MKSHLLVNEKYVLGMILDRFWRNFGKLMIVCLASFWLISFFFFFIFWIDLAMSLVTFSKCNFGLEILLIC